MYTRYQIAPSKAVVKVDRHIKAPSMHIQKPLRITKGNQKTNGPVNAHLISWPSKAQNIQNMENIHVW